MKKTLIKQIWPSISFLLFFSFLFGLIYPGVVMFVNQLAFPKQANGSLIVKGTLLGSELIGQRFSQAKYFWSRPSYTDYPYNASLSRGSNLCPANPQLIQEIKDRIALLKKIDPQNTEAIPIDLVTCSASGLDPHISVEAALYQVNRIATKRQINKQIIHQKIKEARDRRQFGFLGEKRVNVVKLNLLLDEEPNS